MNKVKTKYKCIKCGNLFATKGGCHKKHENVCNGEYKPFVKSTHCKYCNKLFSETDDRANHTRWCKERPENKNKTALRKAKVIVCTKCGVSFCLLNMKHRVITCSPECAKTPTEECKKRHSENRKKFLRENPDKHPWKSSSKFISEPCEKFKRYLTSKGFVFEEEYSPSKERAFAIDIALVDLKIGIEVNGNQHYNRDGTLALYYQQRHDFIESLGWKLIEVHYSECFYDESIAKVLSDNGITIDLQTVNVL